MIYEFQNEVFSFFMFTLFRVVEQLRSLHLIRSNIDGWTKVVYFICSILCNIAHLLSYDPKKKKVKKSRISKNASNNLKFLIFTHL